MANAAVLAINNLLARADALESSDDDDDDHAGETPPATKARLSEDAFAGQAAAPAAPEVLTRRRAPAAPARQPATAPTSRRRATFLISSSGSIWKSQGG